MDGGLRILVSTRDELNRSSTGSFDAALEGDRFELLSSLRGPHFGPGVRGAFDADGVTMSQVLRHDGRLYGFYLGWTVLKHVPFANFIGVCVSDDDGDWFTRLQPHPIVGRTRDTPFSTGYPCVRRVGAAWRMWFGNHRRWGDDGLDMEHVISTATGSGFQDWSIEPTPSIDVDRTDPEEFAVSRPCVVREPDGSYANWFAVRAPGYRLGFARSRDGVSWQRCDGSVGFVGERGAWEARERTYPWVFDHGGRRYMLYNGDGYGRTGFGIAVLEA